MTTSAVDPRSPPAFLGLGPCWSLDARCWRQELGLEGAVAAVSDEHADPTINGWTLVGLGGLLVGCRGRRARPRLARRQPRRHVAGRASSSGSRVGVVRRSRGIVCADRTLPTPLTSIRVGGPRVSEGRQVTLTTVPSSTSADRPGRGACCRAAGLGSRSRSGSAQVGVFFAIGCSSACSTTCSPRMRLARSLESAARSAASSSRVGRSGGCERDAGRHRDRVGVLAVRRRASSSAWRSMHLVMLVFTGLPAAERDRRRHERRAHDTLADTNIEVGEHITVEFLGLTFNVDTI